MHIMYKIYKGIATYMEEGEIILTRMRDAFCTTTKTQHWQIVRNEGGGRERKREREREREREMCGDEDGNLTKLNKP